MPRYRIADDGGYDDWWLLGLSSDPVPLNADALRTMAARYRLFADDVAASASGARGLLADPVVLSWLGKSATAFKNASEPFPGLLDSAQSAYRETGDAFAVLAAAVDSARQQADALLKTANAGYDAMLTAAGLPDDAMRALAGAYSGGELTRLLDGYTSRSTLSPSAYKANYGAITAGWQTVNNAQFSAFDVVNQLSTAKNTWTAAVEDGTSRATRITAGFSATGTNSLDFNTRYAADGGDLADLVNLEGPNSEAADVAETVAYFHAHLHDDYESHDALIQKLNQLTPDEMDAFINSLSPQDLATLNTYIKTNSDGPWQWATPILSGVSASTLLLVQNALPALLPGTKDGSTWESFAQTPLFSDGQEGITGNPTDTALNQGSGDDCWFLSSISSVAMRNPDFFQSRVIANPNGTYTVTFYDDSGKPFHITVDGQLPVNKDGNLVYAHAGWDSHGQMASIWTPIMEKAYATYVGSYDNMTAGRDSTGLHTLTGQSISSGLASDPSLNDLQHWLDQGDAVQTTTMPRSAMNLNWIGGISTAHLVGAHVYAVERIDRTTHPPTIVLLNPWGAQGSDPDHPYETRITEDQWNANFITYSHTTVTP
jgi:hypothetical protein